MQKMPGLADRTAYENAIKTVGWPKMIHRKYKMALSAFFSLYATRQRGPAGHGPVSSTVPRAGKQHRFLPLARLQKAAMAILRGALIAPEGVSNRVP